MIQPSVPGRVLSIDGTLATIDVHGSQMTANARLVSVKPGNFVLVYGGVILRILDEKEAETRLRTLETLQSAAACPAPP